MSRLTPRRLVVVLTSIVLCATGGSAESAPRDLIHRPLDASAYRNRVCELLTPEQTASFQMKEGREMDGAKSVECRWSLRGPNGPVWLNYFYSTGILAKIYQKKRFHPIGWLDDEFTPLTIAGQPGAKSGESQPPVYCQIAVGLTDRQGIDIAAYADSGDACDLAMEIAEAVVHNLAE